MYFKSIKQNSFKQRLEMHFFLLFLRKLKLYFTIFFIYYTFIVLFLENKKEIYFVLIVTRFIGEKITIELSNTIKILLDKIGISRNL